MIFSFLYIFYKVFDKNVMKLTSRSFGVIKLCFQRTTIIYDNLCQKDCEREIYIFIIFRVQK